jgi:hypothetical protein
VGCFAGVGEGVTVCFAAEDEEDGFVVAGEHVCVVDGDGRRDDEVGTVAEDGCGGDGCGSWLMAAIIETNVGEGIGSGRSVRRR